MRPLLRSLVLLFVLCAACAPAGSPGSNAASAPRQDRNVLTREQLRETGHTNALEAVQALRSNWLRAKGTDSFSAPTQVQVYVDNNQLGGVETLRGIATSQITYIRYYDGVTASGRWGLGHGQGVIYVSTGPN
jgi:glutaredoxin-related protein